MMVPERGLTGTTVPANFPVARLCITWKPNLSGFSEAPITATVLGEKSHLRLSNNCPSTIVLPLQRKFEIRSTKSETNSNDQNTGESGFVLDFENSSFGIVSCFAFQNSDFTQVAFKVIDFE
jgi:hypothetical protein